MFLTEIGLLMDGSGSVTDDDFTQRNAAIGRALRNPWVLSALANSDRGLALGVLQFSGPGQVDPSVSWRVIFDRSSATATATEIESIVRAFAGTGDLDSALSIAAVFSAANGIEGDESQLLVLGDGPATASGRGRDFALGRGIDRISAVVTGGPGDLAGYQSDVVAGAGAEARWIATSFDHERTFGAWVFNYFQGANDTSAAVSSGLGQAVLGGSRAVFSDLEGRIRAQRSGEVASNPRAVRVAVGSKGTPLEVPARVGPVWSAFGSLNAGREDGTGRHGSVYGIPILTQSGYETHHAGGTMGLEARWTNGWRIGGAVVGQHSDMDFDAQADADDDAWGAALYVSHRRTLPWHGIAVHADAMLGWLDHSIELDRRVATGVARSEPQGDSRVLAINVGASIPQRGFHHGPEFGVDLLRGGIDGYRESGPGAATLPATDFSSTVMHLTYGADWSLELAGIPWTFAARSGWEHEFDPTGVGPSGSEIGAAAEDTWISSFGVRGRIRDDLGVFSQFETRLGNRSDSRYLSIGCDLKF